MRHGCRNCRPVQWGDLVTPLDPTDIDDNPNAKYGGNAGHRPEPGVCHPHVFRAVVGENIGLKVSARVASTKDRSAT
jgi:hypothetical protein